MLVPGRCPLYGSAYTPFKARIKAFMRLKYREYTGCTWAFLLGCCFPSRKQAVLSCVLRVMRGGPWNSKGLPDAEGLDFLPRPSCFQPRFLPLCLMAQSCYLGSWEGVCTSHPLPSKLLRAGVLSQLLCFHRTLGLVTVSCLAEEPMDLSAHPRSPVLEGVHDLTPRQSSMLPGL